MVRRDVAVIGDVVCDDWRCVAFNPHNPENAVFCVNSAPGTELILPGGAGLTALCLQQLGANVTLFSRVDTSAQSARILDVLARFGVNIAHVAQVPDWRMPVKTRYFANNKILLRHDIESINDINSTSGRFDVNGFESIIYAAECVVVSDYDKGYLHARRISLIDIAARHAVPVFVDCKGQHISQFNGATAFKINDNAATVFSVLPERAANFVTDLCAVIHGTHRPQLTVVTHGAAGASFHVDGQTHCEPPFAPRQDCNAVGAGDAFMAGMALWLLNHGGGKSITLETARDAVKAGHVVANEKINTIGVSLRADLFETEYLSSTTTTNQQEIFNV